MFRGFVHRTEAMQCINQRAKVLNHHIALFDSGKLIEEPEEGQSNN